MNRPILKSNKTYGNTAFLSEDTQNAIYDACEYAEQQGVELDYAIKNGEHSNGDFTYRYNAKRYVMSWQPQAQTEEAFLDEIKRVLFDILLRHSSEKKSGLNRYVYTITQTINKVVFVYAENAEQGLEWLQQKYSEPNGITFDPEDYDSHLIEEDNDAINYRYRGEIESILTLTAPPYFYEVHEIEDIFTGCPATSNTFTDYPEAVKLYNKIDNEGKPARLLKVDYDGNVIDEIKSNYEV